MTNKSKRFLAKLWGIFFLNLDSSEWIRLQQHL